MSTTPTAPEAVREEYGSVTRAELGIDTPEIEGAAHQVFVSSKPEHAGRAIKLTKPLAIEGTRAGYTTGDAVNADGMPCIRVIPASTGDYLHRILKTNEVFGDDIKILGVLEDEHGSAIATSQQMRAGKPPQSQEAVHHFMESAGFRRVHRSAFDHHCPNDASYYHPEKDVFVANASPTNFADLGDGNFMPLDVLIRQPSPQMREILADCLLETRREHHENPVVAKLSKLRAEGGPDAQKSADAIAKQIAEDSGGGELRARQAVKSFMQGKTEAATLEKAIAGIDTAPSQGLRGQCHSTTASQRP